MAKFNLELPTDVIKQFESINRKCDDVLSEMVIAGAEAAKKYMTSDCPDILKNHIAVSKVYITPSDQCINAKVYVRGYIPFSNPNRKYFFQHYGKAGQAFKTNLGVPAAFLAQMYEYGRSTSPFPKKPFMRKAFKMKDIEEAMTRVWNEQYW